MKFLICGLGSIGQRHIRVIRECISSQSEIAALRSRNIDVVISDALEARFGISPEKFYGIQCFKEVASAMAWGPDIVFVTNPIALHVDTAIEAARARCNIFIEKPLSHNKERIDELHRLVKEFRLKCMVGYQTRYHPAYKKIKSLLDDKMFGNLISANLHFGEWLPGMHPYEDYRISHAARQEQGGGVILCLSHEIDMAYWLFGRPERVYAVGGHLSGLELDVEDTADIMLTCRDDANRFPVHVHLDFLQKPARRFIHIAGEAGTLEFNYYTNELVITQVASQKVETIRFEGFRRNDMFLGEIRDFVRSIQENEESPIGLNEGEDVLDICLAAKKSLETGQAFPI